jgi:hypothetical protein
VREVVWMARQTVAQQSAGPVVPPTPEEARGLIELLRSWQEGDAEEQRETWEFLKVALDEDRPSCRKLFP